MRCGKVRQLHWPCCYGRDRLNRRGPLATSFQPPLACSPTTAWCRVRRKFQLKRVFSMQLPRRLFLAVSVTALLLCGATTAQHEGHQNHPKGHQDPPKAAPRIGDAYPFGTCPVSGKKLGMMGDPLIKLYDGREVRFCCGGCTGKFEKNLAKSLAKIDAKIAADQMPLYPLTTSIVSGEKLPKKPEDIVHGNRLIRLAGEKEKAAFLKAPAKFLEALDKAVAAAQGKSYVLPDCPVSGEEFGSMGKPQDMVIAGRLIRVCCGDCFLDAEMAPAKYIAMVDVAMAKKIPNHKSGKADSKGHGRRQGDGK